MDILCFLNSKDVANYLKEINYNLSPVEMAYLVYHSNHHTLDQKREAWKYITDKYPDAVYGKRSISLKKKLLGEHIKDYLALLDRLIEECKTQDNAVWEYAFKTDEGGRWGHYFETCEDIPYFSSFEKCFNYVYKRAKNPKYIYGKLAYVRIIKNYFDCDKSIIIDFDADENIINVDAEGLCVKELALLWLYYEMWLKIPTPFKRGDIVVNPNKKTGEDDIFVLSTICTWGAEELKKNGFKNGAYRGHDSRDFNAIESNFKNLRNEGDETCMMFEGYSFSKGGLDLCDADNYLDLEYYCGEHNDEYKFLKVFSEYIKGNVDVNALLKFYIYFTMKNELLGAKHGAWIEAVDCYQDELDIDELFEDKWDKDYRI